MRHDIVEYMRRLCDARLTTSLGGNISCRAEDGTILITPSSIDKAKLVEDDIVVLDEVGNILSGNYKPSIEYLMHLYVYQKRSDVMSIIHAHPFYSTLFSASGIPINLCYTAEACKNIKKVAIASYKMMGTAQLAAEVADKATESNVVLMENHGVLSVGKTLLDAFYRMEVLEQAARMTYCSLRLKLNELSNEDICLLKEYKSY